MNTDMPDSHTAPSSNYGSSLLGKLEMNDTQSTLRNQEEGNLHYIMQSEPKTPPGSICKFSDPNNSRGESSSFLQRWFPHCSNPPRLFVAESPSQLIEKHTISESPGKKRNFSDTFENIDGFSSETTYDGEAYDKEKGTGRRNIQIDKITEILKTRLLYAKYKLDYGCQHKSFEQLELEEKAKREKLGFNPIQSGSYLNISTFTSVHRTPRASHDYKRMFSAPHAYDSWISSPSAIARSNPTSSSHQNNLLPINYNTSFSQSRKLAIESAQRHSIHSLTSYPPPPLFQTSENSNQNTMDAILAKPITISNFQRNMNPNESSNNIEKEFKDPQYKICTPGNHPEVNSSPSTPKRPKVSLEVNTPTLEDVDAIESLMFLSSPVATGVRQNSTWNDNYQESIGQGNLLDNDHLHMHMDTIKSLPDRGDDDTESEDESGSVDLDLES